VVKYLFENIESDRFNSQSLEDLLGSFPSKRDLQSVALIELQMLIMLQATYHYARCNSNSLGKGFDRGLSQVAGLKKGFILIW